MADTENLEQELLGDIIKVRTSLETNWGNIKANAKTISDILNHQLNQLNGLSSIETDLENVKNKIENTLSDIDLSYLKSGFQEAEQKFGSIIDPLLNDIESLESDTLLENFKKVMDQMADLDGLPSDIKSAVKPIEHIVEAILGGDFSVALKDLPNHTQSGSGTDTGTKKQAAEATVSLFEGIGSSLESMMTSLEGEQVNPFQTLENGIKSLAKSQLTGLEDNLLANLAALLDDLEGLGPGQKVPLSLQLVMSTLQNLLEDEKAQVSTTIDGLFTQVKAVFDSFKAILTELKTIKLEAGTELNELFALILPDETDPDLIDLISLIIAIPTTLVLESTGKTPIITNPYSSGSNNDVLSVVEGGDNEAIVSGEATLIITGALQIATVYFAVTDKFVDFYYKDKGSVTPYQWKIFKTLFSTACTSTSMALFAPSNNPFTSPTLKSSVWLSQLFTSLGFGFVKGMTDAYQTRKLADLKVGSDFTSNCQVVQTNFEDFYYEFATSVTIHNPQYRSLISEIKKVSASFKPSLPDMRAASIYKSIYSLNRKCKSINNETELKALIDRISNLNIPEAYSETIVQGLQDEAAKLAKMRTTPAKNVSNEIYNFIDELDRIPTKFDKQVSKLKKKVSGLQFSDQYTTAESTKDKILNRNFASVGLIFQIYNSALSSYLYKKSNPNNYVPFSLNIATAVSDFIDNSTGLFWYSRARAKKLSDAQEKFKTYLGYAIFLFGKLLTIASATDKFVMAGEPAQITKATYNSTTNTLTVDFSYEVSVKAGKTMDQCFTITGSGFSINPTTPAANAFSFQLTITGNLVLPATIAVQSGCFTSPTGDAVAPEKVSIIEAY